MSTRGHKPSIKPNRPNTGGRGFPEKNSAFKPRTASKIDPKSGKSKSKYSRASVYDADAEMSPLTWSTLSIEQMNELDNADLDDLPKIFANVFPLTGWRDDLYPHTLMAFYINIFLYARDCSFSPEQIGAFFSIINFAIDKCKDPDYPMTRTLTECRNLVVHHSSHLGDAWDLFGVSESKQVIDFLFLSIFQHYRLIQHFFTHEQEKLDVQIVKTIDDPISPSPLSEASTLEAYELEQGKEIEREESSQPASTLATFTFSIAKTVDEDGNEDESPIDLLSPEDVSRITSETISSLFSGLTQEFDRLLEDQKNRFLAQVAKIT